jgi:periplasmic divalent cation tolerance protein
MSAIVTVYATFPTEEEARSVARTLVEERLAACANILGATCSIYRWEGAVEEASEIAAIFKTAETRAGALMARLGALHSYEVPAITVWPIAEAFPLYEGWVLTETSAA